MDVSGKENLPKKGSFILASNHLSGLDTIILPVSIWHQVAFAAKIELSSVRGLKQLLILTGQILIRRKGASKAELAKFMREVKTALRQGRVLGIFPEGTRSQSGELLAFEPGASFIARDTGCKIVPVGISYHQTDGRTVCRITFGEPLDGTSFGRNALTAELRRRISELSGQKLA